jgi:hypothetical protein
MSKKEVRTINQWYWWLSDDRYMGNDTNFYRSMWVLVRENPKYVTLSNQSITYFTPPSGNITKLLYTTAWNLLTFTDTWDVYSDVNIVPVVVWLWPVVNAIEFRGEVVTVDSNWIINRFNVSTFVLGVSPGNIWPLLNVPPMINVYDVNLYIGGNNILSRLDNTFVITTPVITFRVGEVITWLTFFQESLKIYTRDGTIDWYQYIWDQIGNLPQYSTRWEGIPIQSATQNNDTDLIIAWSDPAWWQIYFVSGTQRQLYTRNDLDMSLPAFPRKAIPVMNNNTLSNEGTWYIPIQTNINQLGISWFWQCGVATIGKYYANYPVSMNIDYETWANFIRTIAFSNFRMYYSTSDNVVIETVLPQNPASIASAPKWGIETNVFIGPGMFYQKKINEIQIGCWSSTNIAGTSIKVYMRTNNTGYTLIATLPITWNYDRKFINSFQNTIGEWNEMQLFFELETTSPAIRPRLFDVNVLYEVIKL